MHTGLGIADSILGSRATYLALRVALVVLALVAAYYVYRVGDLGAQAVWAGRPALKDPQSSASRRSRWRARVSWRTTVRRESPVAAAISSYP